jgi:hypothetical protein
LQPANGTELLAVCFTNKVRAIVNAEIIRRNNMIVDGKMTDGFKLISTKTVRGKYAKNERFRFIGGRLKREDSDEFINVTDDEIKKDFEPAFCLTCHKAQGCTFREPYVIYEIDKFSKRMLYVAISRGSAFDYVRIQN